MRIIIIVASLFSMLCLSQCASYDFARRLRQQGNLLPQEKIERLKIGMSKEEAEILMGTSLINPLFNNSRWDYAYTLRRGNGPLQACTARLYFKGNTLVHLELEQGCEMLH